MALGMGEWDMTKPERAQAIAAHLKAHEDRIAKRTKARLAKDARNKRRGLDAAVAKIRQGMEREPLTDAELINRIRDALGTAEEGENLIAVARDAHRAEYELAGLLRAIERWRYDHGIIVVEAQEESP